MKKIIVFGATGQQGGAIYRHLSEIGHDVSGITSERSQNTESPKLKGLDISDSSALLAALQGGEIAVVNFPLAFDEEVLKQYVASVVQAVKSANLSKVVLISALPLPDKKTGFIAFDSKIDAEEEFRKTGVPIVYIRPPVYLDNILAPWLRPLIQQQGILPYPISSSSAVRWLSHKNLAIAVELALDEKSGTKLNVTGPDEMTGDQLAAKISGLTGKAVSYVPIGPDEFEKNLREALGALTAKGVSDIYRYFDENPMLLRQETPAKYRGRFESIDTWLSRNRDQLG